MSQTPPATPAPAAPAASVATSHPAAAALKTQFPNIKFKASSFTDQLQVVIPKDSLLEIIGFLKNGPLGYNFLSDVTCVDYLNYPGSPKDGRFGLVYVLSSIAVGSPRLILRVFLDDPEPTIESLVPTFAGAEFLEREVFDMFGIKFTHHPDLRRVLTWDGFKAHPLRKDYPVTGRGERENYPVLSRDSS